MTREQSPNTPSTRWEPDGTGVQVGGHAGGDRQVGESYSVRYRRADLPCAFITRTAYPAEISGQPGRFRVEVETEWLTCKNPLDPGGSETWSDVRFDDEPGTYSSITEAEEAASRVATELLTDVGFRDWDGPARG